MSQHDYDIANQTAPNFRSDLNNVLDAIVSNNSGTTEPSVTYANQWWYDSSNDILKIRSGADDAWINLGYLDQSTNEFKPYVGSTQVDTQATSVWEAGTSTTEGIVSPAKVKAAVGVDYQEFTSSGTWLKPQNGTVAHVQVWGAGGAGGRKSNDGKAGGGGGGGEYTEVWVDMNDLASSETVTVGAGGSPVSSNADGGDGGNSSFGSHATALGGQGGRGSAEAGGNGAGPYGGAGGSGGAGSLPTFTVGGGGGGSGSVDGTRDGFDGGNSVFGGAGGGGGNDGGATGFGGVSRAGGKGGDGSRSQNAQNGEPGGGGGGGTSDGTSGAGGDGRVIIWVWG